MTDHPDDGSRRTFRLGPCLGRGGFGEVYRAVMSNPGGLESEVAVKMLHPGLDPVGQSVERLRDEGRLLARLDHPTILRAHDLVLLEGRVSLVAEYVDGQDLGDCVMGPARMPLRALLEVIAAVASALHAAWTAPIGDGGAPLRLVHRDIKPSNIRVSKHGQVKLLDFGIARTDALQREARTQTDLMVGSPAYMAPERFLDNVLRPESDVFALGCTLYEGIVGERLFDGVPVVMMSTMALDRDRYDAFVSDRLRRVPADLPATVRALLQVSLSWDPDDRPSAEGLATVCEELADELSGHTMARWARERRWPGPHEVDGELAGRVVTEGTLARSRPNTAPTERVEPPPAPARRSGVRYLVALVAVAVSVGGVGLAALIGGLGVYSWSGPRAGGAIEAVASPEAPAPLVAATETEALPPPIPEATPEPAPAAATPPVPRPRPSAAPPVAAPVPVTAPAPAPAPAPEIVRVVAPAPSPVGPTARVSATGDAAARLVRGRTIVYLPADVPVGTWQIEFLANKRDWSASTVLEVTEGVAVDVVCSERFQGCAVR